MNEHLIIICGPTGIGKTSVAVEIAARLNTMIISADSRQIYKEMSIGTAAPSKEEMGKIMHYFVRSHSIHEPYNASMYENEVIELLNDHFKTSKLALMAGGSGMYIDAVCKGIDELPSIDAKTREKWLSIFKEKGLGFLQEKVRVIDPEYFSKSDINNPKRLQKAIEIFEISGKPYSSFLTNEKKIRNFKTLKIGLNTDRKELYNRINHRVDKMMERGLLEEATALYPFKHLQPLNTVGYKEIFDYIEGTISLNEAIEKIKDHSRAYARRQITWFRRDNSIQWFEPSDVKSMMATININLNN